MTDRARASIHVHSDATLGAINANLFGLHLEHIWNCVYPCVWVGPESDIRNEDGIRAETVEALRGLRPTVCKYPGGYFTDFYDWRDGVGPRDGRPVQTCPTQPSRRETNHFGTAEFVTFCRLIGAEPYLSVNTTSIGASDAAHWVEYCNVSKGSFWSDRRREDGFEEPFNVRYWAIGNEAYWLHSPEEYAERFRRWAHWMSNIDPAITLVAGAVEPGMCECPPWNVDGDWGPRFLERTSGASWWRTSWHQKASESPVLYSFHPYFAAEPKCSREQYYDAFKDLLCRLPRSIAVTRELLERTCGDAPRPRLTFDEYGLMHPGCAMNGNMTQPAPFWASLWLAAFFHICFEHNDDVGMAALPGMINMEHALLLLQNDRVVTTASYHLFRMLRPHGGADRLETTVAAPLCEPLNRPALWAAASRDPGSGRVTLSVINLDLERDLEADATFAAAPSDKAYVTLLSSEDLHALDRPTGIVPRSRTVTVRKNGVRLTFPRHSVTVLEVPPPSEAAGA